MRVLLLLSMLAVIGGVVVFAALTPTSPRRLSSFLDRGDAQFGRAALPDTRPPGATPVSLGDRAFSELEPLKLVDADPLNRAGADGLRRA